MKKTLLLTGIGLLLLVGVISLNTTQAKAEYTQNGGGNNHDENGGGNNQNNGAISLSHTITATDPANSVVVGPVTTSIFTMIFNTTSDYNGNAQFQIQQNDNSWVPIGIAQSNGFTIVDGVDAIPAAHLKIPLTVRVAVITQATTGSSYAELDYVGSQQTNQKDKDHQGDDWNKQHP